MKRRATKTKLKAHRWRKEKHGHYVEPQWCDDRLFNVEDFKGLIVDPCCGFGRIPKAAIAAGYKAWGFDIEYRGFGDRRDCVDFLECGGAVENIVCNPPFQIMEKFTRHALKIARRKVAMIWLWRRVPAATWLADLPLARVWLLNPRPSMPPGHVAMRYAKRGEEPTGGTQDFCWLVFDHAFRGYPKLDWLKRDPDDE